VRARARADIRRAVLLSLQVELRPADSFCLYELQMN
jgi:hypothetical protein